MKQRIQLKWFGLVILILTFTVVLALRQLQANPAGAELKHAKLGAIAVGDAVDIGVDLNRPMGVAVEGDLLAIADAGNKRLVLVNTKTGSRTVIKKTGKLGELSYPVDTAFGPDGLVYVADMHKGKILGFDQKGGLVKTFPSSADEHEIGGINPTAVAVGNNGNIYVTDVALHRVLIFNSKGKLLNKFADMGSSGGQLLFPNGIALDDAKREIYVSDTNNSRIQVFDQKGSLIRVLSLKETGIVSPRGLAFTEDKTLILASTMNNQLYQYDIEKGKFDIISLNTAFSFPNDVCASNEQVYVADRGNNRLISFSIKGERGEED